MKKIIRRDRKGFVLVLSLLTTTVLLALIIPYVSRVVTDYGLTSKIYNSTAAIDLAEAGIERALWEIIWNNNTFSGVTPVPSYDENNVLTGYSYPITVNSFRNSSNEIVGDYDVNAWLSIDGRNATIVGTGYVPGRTRYDSKKTIKVTYVKNNFSRAVGASGIGGITLGKNSIVDSYDSDNGTYADTHANSDGNIATNGPIVIPNNTHVYGDANPGEDYPFASQPAGVSGSWGTLQAPLAYDPIPSEVLSTEKASGLAAPGHGVITESETGSYTRADDNLVVNKTITLTGGNYYFKSITVNNQGNINVTGQATIYVDGGNILFNTQADMNISAKTAFYVDGGNITIETQGDINTLGVPKNLVIYSTGTNITLITQTDFYGAIYAPNALVSLTARTAGGEMYGAIACDSFVSGTNTGVHFDKALLRESPIFLNSRVSSWQEIQQ